MQTKLKPRKISGICNLPTVNEHEKKDTLQKENTSYIQSMEVTGKDIKEQSRHIFKADLPKGEVMPIRVEWERFKSVIVKAAEEEYGRASSVRRYRETPWWNKRSNNKEDYTRAKYHDTFIHRYANINHIIETRNDAIYVISKGKILC